MKTLILGGPEVSKVLLMSDCIHLMKETFKALARGEAMFPPRQMLAQPDKRGILGMMPGYLATQGIIGLKATSVFPGNLDTQFESHQGAVLLFDTEHGRLLSVVDASSITRIRTAAASGAATDVLAKKDIGNLTILGSGTQAAGHLEAMLTVRGGIQGFRVWSRNPEHARRFARLESERQRVDIQVAARAEDAVFSADLICTTTAAKSPVLNGAWLSPGVHVNAVGSSVPPYRELDTEAVVKSRFFVDSRESAMNEADDFRVPKQEGAIGDGHILGEVGDVLLGNVPGRTSDGDITVFKSVGLAVEDLAAAHFAYTQAVSKGIGTWVEFGGERNASG